MAILYTFPAGLPNPSGDDYQFSEEPRVRKAQFGDGYAQTAKDGLNANPRVFELAWPNLNTAQKDTIINFLRARGGSEAFYWTPPKEVTAIKVKATSWSTQTVQGPWWSLSARFEQVFDQ